MCFQTTAFSSCGGFICCWLWSWSRNFAIYVRVCQQSDITPAVTRYWHNFSTKQLMPMSLASLRCRSRSHLWIELHNGRITSSFFGNVYQCLDVSFYIYIVGPLCETKRGNKQIIVTTEYVTRWTDDQVISDKSVDGVHQFILGLVYWFCDCKIILHNQGCEFNNNTVRAENLSGYDVSMSSSN